MEYVPNSISNNGVRKTQSDIDGYKFSEARHRRNPQPVCIYNYLLCIQDVISFSLYIHSTHLEKASRGGGGLCGEIEWDGFRTVVKVMGKWENKYGDKRAVNEEIREWQGLPLDREWEANFEREREGGGRGEGRCESHDHKQGNLKSTKLYSSVLALLSATCSLRIHITWFIFFLSFFFSSASHNHHVLLGDRLAIKFDGCLWVLKW